MKVMIAAGGTGGHIYPALDLADAIVQDDPASEVIFFGSGDRMEATIIPEKGYRFFHADLSADTYGVLAKVSSAFKMVRARNYCSQLLRKEKPDICVGFGNYISVPLVQAAHALHIPIVLHEQNSFAGKANKFLSRYADVIVCCYESNLEQFPKDKVRIYGNPSTALAAKTEFTEEDIRSYGLDPAKPFVLFMMGSLGSSSVSEVIDNAFERFDDDYQVLVAEGKDNPYTYKTVSDERIRIVPYVDGKRMLKACTVAVTRAGASTIAEISGIGVCAVLIPSPYVSNNHQVYNAKELVSQAAALMIEEKDLTPQRLADELNSLMKDSERQASMRANARKCGKTDAADRMIACMKELVKHG